MRAVSAALAALGVFGMVAVGGAARAEGGGFDDGWRSQERHGHEWREQRWRDHGAREHAWREHEWRERERGRRAFVPPGYYGPPPGYYAPPPAYYPPLPRAYYAPPPVFEAPGVAVGFGFR